jgi:hypothetical protein
MKVKYYLILSTGNRKPIVKGPYKTNERRDADARNWVKFYHVSWMTTNHGVPQVGEYPEEYLNGTNKKSY